MEIFKVYLLVSNQGKEDLQIQICTLSDTQCSDPKSFTYQCNVECLQGRPETCCKEHEEYNCTKFCQEYYCRKY